MVVARKFKGSPSAAVRAKLDHPVIDGDGHFVEIGPVFLDYLKDVGGPSLVERYLALIGGFFNWYTLSPEERRAKRTTRPPWWFLPAANTVDRATAMLPRLMRERLDEFGIDFALLYTTEGLAFHNLADAELRCATMRAMNTMIAELYGPHADRMTPVALIPVHTPEEAITELEFVVNELKLKAIMICGSIRRPLPDGRYWIDNLALDSAHDYDPFWRRCVELKVAPTDHSSSMGWINRGSISNYNYNHIGHFAAASEVFCKALFMGGVTRRFPTLKFAFLECGVGWACSLYHDLIGHWEKRNLQAVKAHLDPAKVDRPLFVDLVRRYGDQRALARLDEIKERDSLFIARYPEKPEDLDEWAACRIASIEDIRDLFVPNFYFGCEADDRTVAWAFNHRLNHCGARLKAVFSSDVGHWDVTDCRAVLAEANELVEKGYLTDDDFRAFVFENPLGLHAGMNRDFFKGTVVEAAAARALRSTEPQVSEQAR